MSRAAKQVTEFELVAGEHADRLELAGAGLVGFIQDEDGGPAPLFGLGGQRVGGLGQQGSGVEAGGLAAGGDDLWTPTDFEDTFIMPLAPFPCQP